MGELVAGRTCGACTACCVVPAIDDPTIQKPAAIRCCHSVPAQGGGASSCAIYDTRPDVCRRFHCAWRRLGQLDDAWRPDKSHVFIIMDQDKADRGAPGNSNGNGSTPPALTLVLIGNPLMTVREHRVVDFVRTRALHALPTFLALPGQPGLCPLRVMLPAQALHQAARHSAGAVKALLEQALKALKAEQPATHVLTHSGNDVGTAREPAVHRTASH